MADRLLPDQALIAGTELISPNGRHRLVMQGDGNLVLYRQSGVPKWATGTDGRQIGAANMQGDGNLVLYDPTGAVWATGTDGNPGAVLVMQDDGNLVIYSAGGAALWASGTVVSSVRVTGFMPSTNAFHFTNSFPHGADIQINVLGQNVAIGDSANGLCGGMVFAVRDIFEARMVPPPVTRPPAGGPLFDFIARRLFDSFELPAGPLHYMHLMNPAVPDHETWFSEAGLAPRGRAWTTIVEEWPKVRAGLDGNRLMPLALNLVKSLNPGDMGNNHQVLSWGYDLDGADLSILIYDPNCPDDNDVRIELNIGNPRQTTAMRHSKRTDPVWAFFTPAYLFAMPPDFTNPVAERILKVQNASGSDKFVRLFNPGDAIMAVALTAGEFDVPTNQFGTWVFQNGISQVMVTANGRPVGLGSPGETVTITQDDTVMVRNVTPNPVQARFFHPGDGLMWITLPGGDLSVPPFGNVRFTIPANLSSVKLNVGGRISMVAMAEVVVFSG
jgi:hypothetical protein